MTLPRPNVVRTSFPTCASIDGYLVVEYNIGGFLGGPLLGGFLVELLVVACASAAVLDAETDSDQSNNSISLITAWSLS